MERLQQETRKGDVEENKIQPYPLDVEEMHKKITKMRQIFCQHEERAVFIFAACDSPTLWCPTCDLENKTPLNWLCNHDWTHIKTPMTEKELNSEHKEWIQFRELRQRLLAYKDETEQEAKMWRIPSSS